MHLESLAHFISIRMTLTQSQDLARADQEICTERFNIIGVRDKSLVEGYTEVVHFGKPDSGTKLLNQDSLAGAC